MSPDGHGQVRLRRSAPQEHGRPGSRGNRAGRRQASCECEANLFHSGHDGYFRYLAITLRFALRAIESSISFSARDLGTLIPVESSFQM